VLVDSGMVGCFDRGSIDAGPIAAVGPSQAMVVNGQAVVAGAGLGDGRYRVRAWRNGAGEAVAVSLDLLEYAGSPKRS
jgi:hypothetical protein